MPTATDVDTAIDIIAGGAEHRSMPVWGDVLTEEQLTALVSYTLDASRGTPVIIGQELYGRLCSSCHGDFGEGGPHPTDVADIIAPISTALYLETRDNATLRAIISKGQPDQGMAPFLDSEGGPLTEDEVAALVAFMRSWEANPPVEFPPDLSRGPVAGGSTQLFSAFCAQCHGGDGAGGPGLVGPSLTSDDFQDSYTDESLHDVIANGHAATSMIAWGEVLTASQIDDLVGHIRSLGGRGAAQTIVYSRDIEPIFHERCFMCHGPSNQMSGFRLDQKDAAPCGVRHAGRNVPPSRPGVKASRRRGPGRRAGSARRRGRPRNAALTASRRSRILASCRSTVPSAPCL